MKECVSDDEEEQQDEGYDELTSYDMEDVDNMWKEACALRLSYSTVCAAIL